MKPDEVRSITIDNLLEASAAGVLRALDARHPGDPLSSLDYVKNGFIVSVNIINGGISAALLRQFQAGSARGLEGSIGQEELP